MIPRALLPLARRRSRLSPDQYRAVYLAALNADLSVVALVRRWMRLTGVPASWMLPIARQLVTEAYAHGWPATLKAWGLA